MDQLRKIYHNNNYIMEVGREYTVDQIKATLSTVIPDISACTYDEAKFYSTGDLYFYKNAKTLGN